MAEQSSLEGVNQHLLNLLRRDQLAKLLVLGYLKTGTTMYQRFLVTHQFTTRLPEVPLHQLCSVLLTVATLDMLLSAILLPRLGGLLGRMRLLSVCASSVL